MTETNRDCVKASDESYAACNPKAKGQSGASGGPAIPDYGSRRSSIARPNPYKQGAVMKTFKLAELGRQYVGLDKDGAEVELEEEKPGGEND